MIRLCLIAFLFLAYEVAAEESENAPKDGVTLPLESDKTLSFSVNEATWMSRDVSPQGDRLVIEALAH